MSSFCGSKHVSSLHTQACFLRASSWYHIWKACLCCGFFSPTSVLWDTPPHRNPFKRKGLIHSFSDGLSSGSSALSLQGTHVDQTGSRSMAVALPHQGAEYLPGRAELRKRCFWTPCQAHCVKTWAQGPCMAWGSAFLCISGSALQVIQGPHFRKPSSKCF